MVPWGAMRACFVWWSACVAPFAATGSLFEEEMEIHAAHSVVAAAKTAKRELDAMRKAHDVAMADITSLRRLIAEDGYQVGALAEEVELAESEGLAAIADYSRLVVFMQRCDDGSCLDKALNSTEAQLTALLSATATEHAQALEARVGALVGENVRLTASLERSAAEYSALEERSEDEIYRLMTEVDKHESAEKRMKEKEDKQNGERDRVDADKKQLEDEVKEIQKHRSWECDVLTTHDDLAVRGGSYVVARLYDFDKGRKRGAKPSLWWAVAEVLDVLEGDGVAPESLLEVRLFKEYIKHVSNYAVNGAFDRDMTAAGLVTLRRDEIAYVDLKLSGAGDPTAGKDPGSGGAGRLALAPGNGTEPSDDDDDDDEKRDRRDPRGAKEKAGAVDSDKDKEEKAKATARKKGTRISELEKRGVVARLKADEAAWEQRDKHRRHEVEPVEVGKYVFWHYSPAGKLGELWFRLGKVVRVDGEPLKDDKDGKNSNLNVSLLLRAMDPPIRYPVNESRLKDKFRVRGEVDDPREAIEDARKAAERKKERDLKKKKEKGEKVSDEEKNATAFDEADFNRTHFNLTTEAWDLDPGGLELIPGNASLVVVHRSSLAYVNVDVTESKASKGRVATYSIRSSFKSDTEDILVMATTKWWYALAEEWKASLPCLPPDAAAPNADANAARNGGHRDKHQPPKPPTYGGEYKANATDGANATATANGTLPDPDAVAQAIAVEYLNRYRTKAEVLESVDARLEALDKKLAWLADALARSLLTDDEHAAEKAKLLAAFEAIEQ